MNPAIVPIRSTQSFLEWVLVNRHEVMIGALVAAAIVAVMIVLRYIGQRIVEREQGHEHFGWRSVVGRVLTRTSILFMVVTAVDIVASYAEPPQRAQHLVDIAFTVIFAVQGAIWARELILALIARKTGEDEATSTLGNATAIVRVLVSVTLFAIAFIVILDNLGVNVTALVAGLGIGGIAIGLAAQGIFSDLFSALAILFDKPFRRGDTIRYGTTTGTVEQIGLKTTRIRSQSGEQVVMSNKNLLDQEIFNVGRSRARRTWLPIGIIYQTPPELLERLPEMVEEVIKPIKSCRFVRCCIKDFGASSIDFELVYDDKAVDFDTIAKHRSTICLGILRAFAENGVQFAYPTQTTFTAAPDGTMIMPYAAVQPVVQANSPVAKKAKG